MSWRFAPQNLYLVRTVFPASEELFKAGTSFVLCSYSEVFSLVLLPIVPKNNSFSPEGINGVATRTREKTSE